MPDGKGKSPDPDVLAEGDSNGGDQSCIECCCIIIALVQQKDRAFNSMGQRAILALNHRQHQTSIIP